MEHINSAVNLLRSSPLQKRQTLLRQWNNFWNFFFWRDSEQMPRRIVFEFLGVWKPCSFQVGFDT